MIPDACNNLKSNPVPVSVVLKRIPFEAFEERDNIRHLQNSVVDSVIRRFGELIDIQNRFSALQGSTAKHKDLIPNLGAAVNGAALSFQGLTTPLLQRLAAYVAAYKSDKPTENFVDLLTDVETEIDKQKSSSSQTFLGYPMHLTGLEDAFKSFALLFYKIANRTINPMFYITPLSNLRKDVVMTPIVALLIIPPLPAQPDQIDDLALRALLVDAVAYYVSMKPPVKLHIIYTEDLSKIDSALRGNGMFMQLKVASVFLGQKKMGAISWTPVPEKDLANTGDQLCDLRLDLRWTTTYVTILSDAQITHDFLSSNRLYFSGNIPDNMITSQTIIMRVQYSGNTDSGSCYFAKLAEEPIRKGTPCYTFYVRPERSFMDPIDYLDVRVDKGDENSLGYLVDGGSDVKKLDHMQNFHCAFVQDTEKSSPTWTLYFNGAPVGKMAGSIDVMSRWKEVSSCSYGNVMAGKVRSTYFFVIQRCLT